MARKNTVPKVPDLAREAYRMQQRNAAKRSIGWDADFTADAWWRLWWWSGHWDQRGPAPDQFCMARIGDRGPYAEGNVVIITNRANNASSGARFGIDRSTRKI